MALSMGENQPATAPVTENLEHVTQEMYKKNLELADRNKTLALLRKMDEIVLGSVTDAKKVAEEICKTIVAETDFNLATIFILSKDQLVPIGTAYHDQNGDIDPQIKEQVMMVPVPIVSSHIFAQAIATKQIQLSTSYPEILKPRFEAPLIAKIQEMIKVQSIFICPLVVRDKAIGVINIGTVLPADQLSDFKKNLIDRLSGVIGIAVDNALLYEQIQETTEKLRDANDKLKELDKAKDDFISMASHQLRTPLTTIKGYVSMMEEGDAGAVSEDQHKFLKNALNGADRMGKMIVELLNVSRMSTGKFKIEPKLVELGSVVEEEVGQLKLNAESKQIKLVYQKPAQPVNCELDVDKTRQVIMNFIDNAIYYTKQGSVTATLEQTPQTVIFKVVDTGIGVPKAALPKLFSKFYRADNAKVARPDGTGLGLYLAKRVVEEQGGKIIFETVEGKGSTFGFELPKKVVAPAA